MTAASKTLYAAVPMRRLLLRGFAGIALGAVVATVARLGSELWLAGVAPSYGIGTVSFGAGSTFLSYITVGIVIWGPVALLVLLLFAPERRPPRLIRRVGFVVLLASVGLLLVLSVLSPPMLLFGPFGWWCGVLIATGTALMLWSPKAKTKSSMSGPVIESSHRFKSSIPAPATVKP